MRYMSLLFLCFLGCGKTSAILFKGRSYFLILMECPDFSSETNLGALSTAMRARCWEKVTTEEEAQRQLYIELAARLLILLEMLGKYPALQPLEWLLFTLSASGRDLVQDMVDKMIVSRCAFEEPEMSLLVKEVNGKVNDRLIIAIDELQAVAAHMVTPTRPVSAATDEHNISMISIMTVMVKNMREFPYVIWSGSRVGVTAGDSGASDVSGIGKLYRGNRVPLSVIGEYQFLESGDVERLLESILVLDLSKQLKQRLFSILVGRARTVATFVSCLLIPGSAAMNAADKPVLTDAEVEPVLEDLIENLMMRRFSHEIKMMLKRSMKPAEVGHLWAVSMLALEKTRFGPSRFGFDNLAFTERTQYNPDGSYSFQYRFDEPLLQDVLMKIVRASDSSSSYCRSYGSLGIESLLQSTLTNTSLGEVVGFCVALQYLRLGKQIMSVLCAEELVTQRDGKQVRNGSFGRYAAYDAEIRYIVRTSSDADQLEWFELVTNDSESLSFSLLPGVKVKHIAILPSVFSGADIIFASFPPAAQTMVQKESEEQHLQRTLPCSISAPHCSVSLPLAAAEVDSRVVQSTATVKEQLTEYIAMVDSSPMQSRYKRRSRAVASGEGKSKKLKPDSNSPTFPSSESQSQSQSQAQEGIVFVHTVCAAYSKGVTKSKHSNQEKKSVHQYGGKKLSNCGKRYRAVASKHYKSGSINYLPVLVEIPQHKPIYADNYILATHENGLGQKLLDAHSMSVLVRKGDEAGVMFYGDEGAEEEDEEEDAKLDAVMGKR